MIAHIDADAFFASALQRRQPELRGKPVLALGMGGGCVIAASYEAKAFGVKTGMPLSEAKRLCPKAIAIPSDFEEALLASRQIESILKNQCPLVEQMSVDEWFLDLTSLVGGAPAEPAKWATALQKTVQQQTALSVSVGIAGSKLLSKMASEYRKPAGVSVVDYGSTPLTVKGFLRDRPAAAIPGVGRRRSLHTTAEGWQTAWDIAVADAERITAIFGRPGRTMQRELLGECLDPVTAEAELPKSISRCRSFPPNGDALFLYSHLLHHVTYSILKMRRKGLACRSLSVWLRDGQYRHHGAEAKLSQPADTEERLLPYVQHCFRKLYQPGQRYTQAGLALGRLEGRAGEQYSLFEDPTTSNSGEQVQSALDALHERFGREAIKRASALATKSTRKKQLHLINNKPEGIENFFGHSTILPPLKK